jgi:hypothetical protein
MRILQWVRNGTTATHLVGDEGTGVGIVIDPPEHPEEILDEAERLGLSVQHVFFTADQDFPSLLPFRERGAHVYRGSRSIPRADATPLLPGCSITIGRLRVQAELGSARRVAYHVFEIGDDGRAELLLAVRPDAPSAAETVGEYDGYPRSSFLHAFSRW